MNSIRRTLKLANEAEPMSREQYSYESWALGTIKGMVSIWADDTYRGEPLKGHNRNRWAKEVLERIKELHQVFEEVKR
jgi:hypothetical protein|tara:strand:- start:76 stop:309 length:234 start_codon:yes stop_codon:yes gene_type:complete